MNSNQIHIYEDYAVAKYGKPNGNEFVPDVHRIKVTRVFGEVEHGRTRETGYVEGLMCNHETGTPFNSDVNRYRARDVISDWDEWEDAKELYDLQESKEQQELERRKELERQEIEARRREREARELERRQQLDTIKDRLKAIGIFEAVADPYTQEVKMSFKTIQEWLDSLDKSRCEQCGITTLVIPQTTGFEVPT